MTAMAKNDFVALLDKGFSFISEKSIKYPHYTKSLIVHFFLVLLLSGMLPKCSKDIEKPKIIAIDILPIGEAPKTTPQAQAPKPKVEEKKPEVKKPVPPKVTKKPEDATKMEKTEKPKPVAKPAVKKPAPTKVEKKPEIKEVKKEDQQKKDTSDQEGKKKLLKDLEKKEQAQLDELFEDASTKPDKPVQQAAQSSGKSEPVVDAAFVNELMGKIQGQISQCWNIPIGAEDVQNIKVKLYIALTSTGAVTDVKIIDTLQYNTDNVFRVIADSAVWAVKECSPLQGLPVDKYDVWKEIEFNFDPSLAL